MEKKLKDDRIGGNIGVKHQLRKGLFVNMVYRYGDRDSNIEHEEFGENRSLAQFQLNF